jgi:hypothetical protein
MPLAILVTCLAATCSLNLTMNFVAVMLICRGAWRNADAEYCRLLPSSHRRYADCDDMLLARNKIMRVTVRFIFAPSLPMPVWLLARAACAELHTTAYFGSRASDNG